MIIKFNKNIFAIILIDFHPKTTSSHSVYSIEIASIMRNFHLPAFGRLDEKCMSSEIRPL